MSSRSRATRRSVRQSVSDSRRQRFLRAAVEPLEVRCLLSHTLTISTAPTSNVTTVGGSFTASADNANLNITDLQNAVNAGDVTVSTGSDGTQAGMVFWLGNADLSFAGATPHTLSIDTASDPLGGFHLFSNILTSSQLNINLSSAGVVDLAGNIVDAGAAVSITANSFDFSNNVSQLNIAGGAAVIQESTAGRPIDVGQGTAGGALGIRSADLNKITAGSIRIGNSAAGTVTVTSAVQQASDANITVVSGNQILVPTGGSWTTNHGSLTLQANEVPPLPSVTHGIYLHGGQLASNDGAILLQGTSSSGGGIVLDSAATIQTTAGNVTLQGTGTDGIDAIGGSTISSGGDLSLAGHGGSTAGNAGVVIGQSGSLQTLVSVANGALSVIGTVPAGAAGNEGVVLSSGAAVRSTGSGSVSLTGTASTPDTPGVFFDHGSTLAAGTGNVFLTADTIDLGDFHSMTASGSTDTLTFQPLTPARNIVLNSFTDVPGALTLTAHDLAAAVLGTTGPGSSFFASLVVGRSDGTGAVTTANNLTLPATLTVNSPAPGSAGINITNALATTTSPLGGAGLTLNTGGLLTTGPTGLISSPSISLIGRTGIGSAASPVSIKTGLTGGTLAALNTTGGIYINVTNPGALRIGGVGNGAGITSTTSGDIVINNPGNFTLDATGEPVQGAGNILLHATGATSDIRIGQGSVVMTSNGTVTLQADRDIIVGTNGSGGVNNQITGNDSAMLSAGRDAIVNNLGSINASGTGTISVVAGRNVQILHTQAASGARVWSQSGAIQFTTGAGGTFTLDGDTNVGTVRSNLVGFGADITISADVVMLTTRDTIAAGTGVVTIQPVTAGRKIDLGSATDVAANTLELSNVELADIKSASVLRIGRSSGDGINISAPIAPANISTLSLINGGAISQAPGASLTVARLVVNSAGPDLLTAVNAVGTLASTTTQSFQFNNGATPLAIGIVDGLTGVTTSGGNIEIDADALDVQQAINAGAGNVLLAPSTAGTGISVGNETAGSLSLTDTELGNVTAHILQIGNASAADLFVNSTINTHPGFSILSLQSGARVVDLGQLSVASLSTITGANTFLNAPNHIGTYAGQTTAPGQPITIQDLQDLTIGTVGGISGISTINANANVSITGNIIINSDITTGNGAVTLIPNGGDVTQAATSTISGRLISQNVGHTLSSYAGTLHAIGTSGITLNVNAFSVSGNVIVDSGPATFISGSTTTSSTVSGVISGAGQVVVNGPGTVTFTGADTYTGTTSVNQGNLVVNGSVASPSAFTVLGGSGTGSRPGTLGGTGSIASPFFTGSNSTTNSSITFQGAVTVNGGTFRGTPTILGPTSVLAGTVAPRGAVIGTMNTAAVTFNPGTTYSVNLTNTGSDLLNATGDINLGGASLQAILAFAPTSNVTFTIMQTSGALSGQFAQGSSIALGTKRYAIIYTPHSVILEQSADLGVSVSGPSTVTAGGTADYTITVTNNGPTDAVNVVVTDTLPSGESYLSTSSGGPPQSTSNNQIVFTSPAMASGASQVYVITARLSSALTPGTVLVDTATASSDIPDNNSANNTASTSATVSTSADLSISPTAPATGVENSPVTLNFTVHNNGPSDAQNVVVTVPIPAGATYVSSSRLSGPAMTFTAPSAGNNNLTITMASLGSGTSGTFSVTVTPAEEGPLTLTPTVSSATSDPNSANNTTSATVNVADAAITVNRLFGQPFPFEGQSFTADLATIADADSIGSASDFTAMVTWGDGSVSAATLAQPGGAGTPVIVTGTHTYSEEGVFNVSIAVTDVGGSTGTTRLQLLVVDSPLTAQPAAVNATKAQSFTAKVASFTDASSTPDINDYIAAINWGDGVVSEGLIQANNTGGFDVIGTHTYAHAGTQPIVVTIHDVSSGAVAFSTANIALGTGNQTGGAAVVGLSAANFTTTEGHAFSRQVAAFKAAAGVQAPTFTASVAWGDGTTSAATIDLDAAGVYHVLGSHAFAEHGAYQGKVTILNAGSPVAAATFKASVLDAPLTAASPHNLAVKVNHAFSGVVGAFSDGNTLDIDATSYTATILWGDGKSSAAQISLNTATGKWQLLGAHTYKSKGQFKIHINVKDAGGAAVQVAALITVS